MPVPKPGTGFTTLEDKKNGKKFAVIVEWIKKVGSDYREKGLFTWKLIIGKFPPFFCTNSTCIVPLRCF